MPHTVHPIALFRLSVLGPLSSQLDLPHGERSRLIKELASRPYEIPGSRRCYLSEKTIEAWYYAWKHGGVDALAPRERCDKGQSKLDPDVQERILQAKRENPKRSLDELCRLLEAQGVVAKGTLKRGAVHRLLKRHGLSRPTGTSSPLVERRSFEAEHAGDIWYGDVMHGPKVPINGQLRKAYLVSLMDDASRLITHSAFCPGETALDIEGVLKQAILKRSLPRKLVIDNGPAYRAATLQSVCARLSIQLVYCRAYEPESKGKIERWHRLVRNQFLSELTHQHLRSLDTLNTCLWAWVEQVYHQRVHSTLACTPLHRWQQDLETMRSLGPFASDLDALLYHREKRRVRKDGTVSFEGRFFEVPYSLVGRSVALVVDPQAGEVHRVESLEGEPLGAATPLDRLSNSERRRCRSTPPDEEGQTPPAPGADKRHFNAIDHACQQHGKPLLPTDED
ncbi:MAG: DDE-type integrase/transposase/recombinase [Pseudomonadota bacterium]|nr:MAG: DDE-type integrase/transposase/recombinase [Pseudomonadota bacterium]